MPRDQGDDDDSQQKNKTNNRRRMNLQLIFKSWKGSKEFGLAQAQVTLILALAWLGNNFPKSYPRNDNHNMFMFYVMNAAFVVAGLVTLHHDAQGSSRGVQLLSRPQTEEWKGWMQWAFIMYHYYRAYSVYNEIRVFVSAYVWMTGFGNFLYFDKKQDFTFERAVSMWLRINYFPLLLSFFLGVKLELYYVVPLHTAGFFITMITCYLAKKLETIKPTWSHDYRTIIAIAACGVAHVVFYETSAVNFLKVFSDEYFFRFQSDKYSAFVGIMSGFFWDKFKTYMKWAFNDDHDHEADPALHQKITASRWAQRVGGVGLMAAWYLLFGHIQDKYTYNPIHPFVFWMPIAGWLMVRNSSKWLTEVHCGVMEFFGRITLETYVLQFHLFMCRDVQHIPIVIPGSGPDGPLFLRTLNMLFCGCIFVGTAWWARRVTVSTQTTVTELVGLLMNGGPIGASSTNGDDHDEGVALTKPTSPGAASLNHEAPIVDSSGKKMQEV
ncbi:hypothetical protein MPSEU_000510800 [Mayamaea pseudoterrestris]|nr:hypothetical protein MPSEU_000510800 [Mayamaea pseudoterrestris]